jgi:protein-disulfide isomerase
MAEAGRSLRNFYLVLAAIAVIGIVLIVRAATSHPPAPLVMADCGGPPLGAVQATGQVLGSDSAPVQIDEYSDFECPFCARFAIVTMPDVRQRLIPTGKVRWRYMDFPLQGHTKSPVAHVAAACAADQGKFWEMQDALYGDQNTWVEDSRPERKFIEYARRIGLNADSFRVCLETRRPWPKIEANRCSGEKLGINGTPTFFVNGHQLPEPSLAFDDLTRIVDSVIAARAAPLAPAKRR